MDHAATPGTSTAASRPPHATNGPRALSVYFDPRPALDALIVADPDRSRLRLGARATLTAALNAVLLFRLAEPFGLARAIPLLGVVIGMMSSNLVRDPEPRAQHVTHSLMPIPALAGVASATVLAGSPPWAALVFLVIIFFAIYVRRYGQRATALGMLGFLSYFDALFFHAPASGLGWMALSIVIGIGVAFFVRAVVIPESPRLVLRRTLQAYPRALRLVVQSLARASAEGRRSVLAHVPRVRERLRRLSELSLAIDVNLQQGPEAWERELRLSVLDLEIAAARLARCTRRALLGAPAGSRAREQITDALRGLARELVRTPPQGEPKPSTPCSPARCATIEIDTSELLCTLQRMRSLAFTRADAPSVAPSAQGSARATAAAAAPSSSSGPSTSTRIALQGVVGCALAMLLGHRVSDYGWYWAVVTAFVVFNQVQTSSDTFMRAWQRVVGTVTGVIAGILLAHAAAHHHDIELALVFTCIFLGFYMLRVSYAWMVFWISALLAVLYSLLGRPTTGLLELRVLETLIGALAGALASAVIFPTRKAARVKSLCAALLERVAAYVRGAFLEGADRSQLLESGRALDRALTELTSTARPFARIPSRSARRALALVDAASLLVMVTRLSVAEASSVDEQASRRRVTRLCERLERTAGTYRAAERSPAELARPSQPHLPRVGDHPALDRLEQALADVDSATFAWDAARR